MDKIKSTNKKLGMIYSEEKTIFRVWSPLKEKIDLLLYLDNRFIKRKSYTMVKDGEGVHELILKGDYKGCFYNYLVDGHEVTDPYSIASSINSDHSAIIDLKDTNPKGWDSHFLPRKIKPCDSIIYEVHIKDFTISETSGVKNKGKFLGFIEDNTEYNGLKTGISHLKELGITHVHLLPVYDFYTVNEEKENFYKEDNYNWGYDPELYNVVEGSYARKPEDPINRIKEFKKLIMGLHEAEIRVVLDVVYNHTYKSYDSNLNRLMPNYYYRVNETGEFSDGSGTGNELDTEKPMVQKFIIESLLYWVEEFKIDGFRFDLMGLIDINTTEKIIEKLRNVNPNILIYGEPWVGGDSVLPMDKRTLKGKQINTSFAFFNDGFRDSIKGDNDGIGKGFIQGNTGSKLGVERGIAGSIYFGNIDLGFTKKPSESINYVNSHDNLILYDKIKKVFPHMAEDDRERLNKLAFGILFTSQGIPFFHGGNEFLRTKCMVRNSYKSPISINAIDWALKEKNLKYFNYFKDLINLRKEFKEFRLNNKKDIQERLRFFNYGRWDNIIIYTLSLDKGYLLIIHNGEFYTKDISRKDILSQINKFYGETKKEIDIVPIFDINGLIKKRKKVELDYIKVPYFSTMIYKIDP
ncbi:MAG TPA: type I pullulanase [Tissierellaceae bacterium]|nr:type I pullulanase [Tissierellaceae bacterium]